MDAFARIPQLLNKLHDEVEFVLSQNERRVRNPDGRVMVVELERDLMMLNLNIRFSDAHLHRIICSKSIGGRTEKLSNMVLSTPSGKLYAWSGETTEPKEKKELALRLAHRFGLPPDHECSFALEKLDVEISQRRCAVLVNDKRLALQQAFERIWLDIMEAGPLQERTPATPRASARTRL